VSRDGTDNIVDLELVEKRHGQDHEHAAYTTNQHGLAHAWHQRLCSDRHEAANGTVEDHGCINLAFVHYRSGDHRREHAANSRHVRVGEDVRHRVDVCRRTCSQLRGAVKAEPAEPEDESTQRGKRDVRTRHRVDLLSEILAGTRTDNDGADECRPAAHGMDKCGAGKVREAPDAVEITGAPFPGYDDWIDEGRQDRRKEQERQQLDPLGNGARND